MKNRDNSYDVLRWIALTGIILVHSKPTVFWEQIRNFDVPLMVLVSAVCFNLSGGGIFSNKEQIKEYYKKRFIRLVLPSWIFLTFYFFVSYMLGVNIDFKNVITCYTLATKWYLWIIRILVVIAILAPWLLRYTKPMSNKKLIITCIMGLFLGEFLACLSDNYWYMITVMFIPYIVYYCIGINIFRFSSREIQLTGIIMIAIYIVVALYLFYQTGSYVPTQAFKYPPRFYYTCYALGISAILFVYRERIVFLLEKVHLLRFSSFVGSHTFWIYLWHIPIVDYMTNYCNSITTFFTVYSMAVLIVYIQTILIKKMCNWIDSPVVCKNIKMIFLG